MKLIIANKRFSSWSLRPWLALTQSGLMFEEELIRLGPDMAAQTPAPTGKVPALVDGELVVYESLAICEYIAEAAPHLWPADRAQRARARALSHEMHAGFSALRSSCPMDLYAEEPDHLMNDATARDVARINALVSEAITRSGGPFLFGDFSIADAMYAPVVFRFLSYHLPVTTPEMKAWIGAIVAMPAIRDWRAAAELEADWGEHP